MRVFKTVELTDAEYAEIRVLYPWENRPGTGPLDRGFEDDILQYVSSELIMELYKREDYGKNKLAMLFR